MPEAAHPTPALASYVACIRERGRTALVRTLALVGIAHALFGFASIVLRGTPADRALWIGSALVALTVGASAMMIWQPGLAAGFGEMLRHMTVEKGETLSAIQRRFWAWQGIDAFIKTGGIGIGPGSFRSSSLATAVLGCTGVIGAVTLSFHFLSAFGPLRQSTWTPVQDKAFSTAAASAWAMLMGIAVASIASPTCDPGTDIAMLSGAALALRRRRAAARAMPAPSPHPAPPLAVTSPTTPFMLGNPTSDRAPARRTAFETA